MDGFRSDSVALIVLHFSAPVIVLSCFLISSRLNALNNGDSIMATTRPPWRTYLNWIFLTIILTFIANGIEIVTWPKSFGRRSHNFARGFYNFSSLFIYLFIWVRCVSLNGKHRIEFLGTYLLSTLLNLTLLILDFPTPPGQKTIFDYIKINLAALRILLFLILTVFSAVLTTSSIDVDDLESTPIPPQKDLVLYGTFPPEAATTNSVRVQQDVALYRAPRFHRLSVDSEEGWVRLDSPPAGWLTCMRYLKFFYLLSWPRGDWSLQGLIGLCLGLPLVATAHLLLLFVGRVTNTLAPRQLGIITEMLTRTMDKDSQTTSASVLIGILEYVILYFMQATTSTFRSIAWLPVSQHYERALVTKAFDNVHSFSHDFHVNKKTGEVLIAMRSCEQINTLLEIMIFQIISGILDLVVAGLCFCVYFGTVFTMIAIAVITLYTFATIKMSRRKGELSREALQMYREENVLMGDSFSNYEAVKFLNAEEYESHRFRNVVKACQSADWKVHLTLNVMNINQRFIFTVGLLIVCLQCARQVSESHATVKDFVILIAYWFQLQDPLSLLGDCCRGIHSTLVHAEPLIELLSLEPAVKDKPDAKNLVVTQGVIRFDGVSFTHESQSRLLKRLTFSTSPGGTVAVVGPSGEGKSTFLKLLFRCWDVKTGAISVDGQDIRDVTLKSLRQELGIEAILFDESILFNIRIAKPDATDQEVVTAARRAQIHDRILGLPEGYNTRVGERGHRLSGGERQRVAIARLFLRKPKIVVLDEANSALDPLTERKILIELLSFFKDCTKIVVAHQLRSILGANLILCIKGGEIAEYGTHAELISLDGVYREMWDKQKGDKYP